MLLVCIALEIGNQDSMGHQVTNFLGKYNSSNKY